MSRRVRQWITAVSLTSYVLVSAVLLPWHIAYERAPQGAAYRELGCCVHGLFHHHEHHPTVPDSRADGHAVAPLELYDDDCPICQSLSQPSCSAPRVVFAESFATLGLVSLPVLDVAIPAVPLAHPSRGPPAA